METVKLLFVVSLTVNISVVVYFLPPRLLVCFLSKQKRRRVVMEFLRFHTKRPNVLRKLLRNSIFSTVLFIFGIYLLVHKRIRENPFERFEDTRLQIAMAVQIGNQLFRVLLPFVPNANIKRSLSCSCYEIVTIFSLLIILITKENNIFAVLTFLFEGGIVFSDISRVKNQWSSDACARGTLHVATLLSNLFATLSLRVVFPALLIVCAIHNASLLKVSYISLALFILNTIFYCSLSFFELFSIYKALRTARTAWGESDGRNDTTQNAERAPINNNNIYPALTRSASLIAMNNLESQHAGAEHVSGLPQALHASRSLDHADRIVIKNF